MTQGRHRSTGTAGRHRAVPMWGLRWYGIDRGVGSASAAVLSVSLAVMAIAAIPNLRPFLQEWWIEIASIAPLLAVVFTMRTLSGDDVPLEQSVPRLRPRWRMTHAVIAVALCAASVMVVASPALKDHEFSALVRNVCGLSGLVLLSTPLFSAPSAWVPTAGYVLFTLLAVSRGSGVLSEVLGWHLQPSARNSSWLAAIALLVVGIAVYVRRGPSP